MQSVGALPALLSCGSCTLRTTRWARNHPPLIACSTSLMMKHTLSKINRMPLAAVTASSRPLHSRLVIAHAAPDDAPADGQGRDIPEDVRDQMADKIGMQSGTPSTQSQEPTSDAAGGQHAQPTSSDSESGSKTGGGKNDAIDNKQKVGGEGAAGYQAEYVEEEQNKQEQTAEEAGRDLAEKVVQKDL